MKKIKRTLVVGDIHGANKALLQVLERCNFDYENDTLISLGDIADGWSETPECVDTLLNIKNLISIRGNHDVWCYDWFKYGDRPMIWTQQGGQATIDAYIRTNKLIDPAHRTFWENQQDWYIDENNNLFIHAGFAYYLEGDFEKQASYKVNAGSIARECHWDRDLLTGAISAEKTKNTFKATEQFNKVFVGHTAMRSMLPEKFVNLWNLDSGAGWHGKLTLMDIDTEEYWQSDLVKDLYPNEKGRG